MSASFLSLCVDAAVEKKQDHSDVLDSSYGEVTAFSGQTAPMCVCWFKSRLCGVSEALRHISFRELDSGNVCFLGQW